MVLKVKLGEILIKSGLIDELQLRSALAYQKKWGGKLGNTLLELGFVTEEQLLKALANQMKLPAVDLKRFKVQTTALKLVPYKTAQDLRVLPLGVKDEGGKKVLYVAMADPTDDDVVSELEFITKMKVKPVIATDSSIERAIKLYYEGDKTAFDDFKTQVMFTERDRLLNERFEGEEKKKDFLISFSSDKIIRALVKALLKKGILTENELKDELSKE